MIILRMKGGLGNQMFQYATGRALSLGTGMPLGLDLRHYGRAREHGYALGPYDLAATVLEGSDLPPLPRKRPLAYALARLTGRYPSVTREKTLGFDPQIAGLTSPASLEGYFQSERYFSNHADTIRTELSPATAPDPENARWLAQIEAEPRAVSLHVRRGDYVRNLKFAAHHGTCTPEYYARALDHVAQKLGTDPVVYVFSDEPDWVADNMPLPGEARSVRHNDAARNFEDIRLMSACRHHIIANSSFSWWGAWMNPRADKVVAAPARWFADPANVNPDIWAQGWTRIDA
jgi:hypothetical protein